MPEQIELIRGDCLDVMRTMADNSVDLVFGSPPYEDARTYEIDFQLRGEAWVGWMRQVVTESVRVCKGLVAFVVEGKQKNYRYSMTPILLMADLHRAGIHLKKPAAFYRIGIPGSGQKDWLRNDYEFIVCATSGGKLPWSDNTAMGEPCKYKPVGALSYRTREGTRINERKCARGSKSRTKTPSSSDRANGKKGNPGYNEPVIANPGNVIACKVGGGHMGSKIAHENEAPFPESLAEFFVRSFCPPDGTVLDPFVGSGTTIAVAQRWGRQAIGIDIRESEIEKTTRRLAEEPVHA